MLRARAEQAVGLVRNQIDSTMGKIAPDFQLKKTIAENEKLAQARKAIKDQGICTNQARWFQQKSTCDHANKEKAQKAVVENELNQANNELKIRRNLRMLQLIENEARVYEEELASLGLRVQRKR